MSSTPDESMNYKNTSFAPPDNSQILNETGFENSREHKGERMETEEVVKVMSKDNSTVI
tara:strand:- start:578 stop:754 length:177 start_codon:yes stop_codon:yes gene_type:complete